MCGRLAAAALLQTKVCFSNISEMQAFLSAFGGSLLWRAKARRSCYGQAGFLPRHWRGSLRIKKAPICIGALSKCLFVFGGYLASPPVPSWAVM